MPAIDLARLKTQAASLADQFDQPKAFVAVLNELLDAYTNRTIRPAQVARHRALRTFNTPRPILRQIEGELKTQADLQPVAAVTLVNALWKSATFESRLLAARLLGMIPPAQAISVLTRLPQWMAETSDEEIRQALLTDALGRLRRENASALFLLLEEWLKSPRASAQIWGLHAVIPLLNEPGFENLPAVFRILRPAVEAAGPSTQLDLQVCLAALSRTSPTETLFFLREILSREPKPMMVRTMRRMLPSLPPDLQSDLLDLLRKPEQPRSPR